MEHLGSDAELSAPPAAASLPTTDAAPTRPAEQMNASPRMLSSIEGAEGATAAESTMQRRAWDEVSFRLPYADSAPPLRRPAQHTDSDSTSPNSQASQHPAPFRPRVEAAPPTAPNSLTPNNQNPGPQPHHLGALPAPRPPLHGCWEDRHTHAGGSVAHSADTGAQLPGSGDAAAHLCCPPAWAAAGGSVQPATGGHAQPRAAPTLCRRSTSQLGMPTAGQQHEHSLHPHHQQQGGDGVHSSHQRQQGQEHFCAELPQQQLDHSCPLPCPQGSQQPTQEHGSVGPHSPRSPPAPMTSPPAQSPPAASPPPSRSLGGPSLALARWRRAAAAVGQVQLLHRHARQLTDKDADPSDRLFAAVRLALQREAWDRLLLGAAAAGAAGAAAGGQDGGGGGAAGAQQDKGSGGAGPPAPHRMLLRHYQEKKRAGAFDSAWERVQAEFVITGTLIFDWCTPARMGEHWPLFTVSFALLVLLVFAFMAAQYPYAVALQRSAGCEAMVQQQQQQQQQQVVLSPAASKAALRPGPSWSNASPAAAPSPPKPANVSRSDAEPDGEEGASLDIIWRCWGSVFPTPRGGPGFLADVLLRGGTSPPTTFSFAFLRAWGARYAPDLQRGQAYRWLSCQLVHTDSRHLAANLLLFLGLSALLETKYGSVRLAAVWLAAVVGGGLLSAATEDPCQLVVGCSGGDFGLLGLFLADTLMGWGALRRPILRCALVAVLLGLLLATLAQQQSHISHMSHVGGLLCGLLPGLLVLPRLGSERWEAAWPALGALGVATWFAVLPAWVYAVRLPQAVRQCGTWP